MKQIAIILAAFLLFATALLPVLADNEGPMDEFEEVYAQGDVNGDGRVNALDYAMVKRYAMHMLTFTEMQFDAADVNGDGKVNALDYMILKRVVMKLGDFPCRHNYEEAVVGNLHIYTCSGCGHQYEEFDGELIG